MEDIKVGEIWKPIKGYEGLYEISNLGRVKALERTKVCNRGYVTIKEHFLKPNNCGTNGYYRVPLTNYKHTKKYYLIHRLVAETFIPNPNNYPQVNHKDGNKENNTINNLEWCTVSFNMRHAYETGLRITNKKMAYEIQELKDRVERLETNCYKVKGEN